MKSGVMDGWLLQHRNLVDKLGVREELCSVLLKKQRRSARRLAQEGRHAFGAGGNLCCCCAWFIKSVFTNAFALIRQTFVAFDLKLELYQRLRSSCLGETQYLPWRISAANC